MAPCSSTNAAFHWIDAAFVEEQGAMFPIWDSPTGDWGGAHLVDHSRSIAAGYTSRPIDDTIRDTLAWWNGLTDEDRPGGAMRSGLRKRPEPGSEMRPGPATIAEMMEIEAALLEAWGARA